MSYADDIVILSHNKAELIGKFEKLLTEAAKMDLIINESKTKYMECARTK